MDDDNMTKSINIIDDNNMVSRNYVSLVFTVGPDWGGELARISWEAIHFELLFIVNISVSLLIWWKLKKNPFIIV